LLLRKKGEKMYKKEERHKQFPCDFCNMNECPLDGEKCPAVNLKSFFKTIDPERVYDAYQSYLETVGLGVIKI